MTRSRAVEVAMVAILWTSCSSQMHSVRRPGLEEWSAGPVRWLLLSQERHDLQRLDSAAEELEFIEEFWRRRDPDPNEPGNPFRDDFLRRVQDADLLYAEPGLRGSLTDRGRTVVLLGAPSNLQISSRPALSWDPKLKGGHRTSTREVSVEIWGYRMEDLPPYTLEMLRDREKKSGSPLSLTLTFIIDQERAKISEGEGLLQQVKRASIYVPR